MKLRRGQRLLYELVCRTLAAGRALRRRDYEALYVGQIRRSERYEREYFDREGKTLKTVSREYTPDETHAQADSWVLRTLGALVTKGALKVIPQIELEDLE